MDACVVSPISRGQFTPLCEALCWTIYKLNQENQQANSNDPKSNTIKKTTTTVSNIQEALTQYFPSLTTPEPGLVHAALSDLIRQRKVYHAGRGYAIVQPDTYIPGPVGEDQTHHSPPKLMTTSEYNF